MMEEESKAGEKAVWMCSSIESLLSVGGLVF